ncbi:hypothetical protein IW261DRAFT_1394538 [Armillaria novae-zelandiae]|uniref:Uncharacterized protein n=1 Tax=Armillaria novae-zelandiae TaxID=153914 RepID=A0AA39PK24_9AGAR|nr:hypothetical protein IW261DRAFT_1394538 [Armillaria novae-zelandiae]
MWTVRTSRLILRCAALRPAPSLARHYSRIFHCTIQRRHVDHRRYNSNSPSQSFSDPTRPDLFYHLIYPNSGSEPIFAVSFLPYAPLTPDSPTIIGWLPAQGTGEESGLNDFTENHKFRDVLHQAIQDGLREGVDEVQQNGATQLQNGWMHIHDERNIPPLGRIGDPDDILASVLVEDGKILATTYQPMPAYRFCTSHGVMQLTPGLNQKLRSLLEQLGT